MRKLKVLSIDWDYLINATATQRAILFPDGGNENMSYAVQDLVWQGRYACEDELQEIEVDKDAYNKVAKLMHNNGHQAMMMVMDSHKGIFNFIENYFDPAEYNGIDLVNIDFHHDYYNEGTELNCGNWVNHLFDPGHSDRFLKGNHSKYTWVCRPDSDKSKLLESRKWFSYATLDEIVAQADTYDLIYLCRSGMWSPPHLDEEFINLFLPEGTEPSHKKGSIDESRYSEEFRDMVFKERISIAEQYIHFKETRENNEQ